MRINNYDTQLEDLMNCPFCGGVPIAYLSGNEHFQKLGKKTSITIKCKLCLAQRTVATFRNNLEWLENKAIDLWNQRVN